MREFAEYLRHCRIGDVVRRVAGVLQELGEVLELLGHAHQRGGEQADVGRGQVGLDEPRAAVEVVGGHVEQAQPDGDVTDVRQ